MTKLTSYNSPKTVNAINYYEKGPTAEYRPLLRANQNIENILSKEEIFKIQNTLLEADGSQIDQLSYSYVSELQRLSEIIQKTLGHREDMCQNMLNADFNK